MTGPHPGKWPAKCMTVCSTGPVGAGAKRQVKNWIYFGGLRGRPYSDVNIGENTGRHRARRGEIPLKLGLALILSVVAADVGQARDPDGRFANSPLKQWFESLKSGKGPCCSDADGTAVADPDWESHNGHYRVRIDGQWIDVPDDAVITEPNRAGRTMVWPVRGYLGLTVRCFMPGSMT